MFKHVQFPSPKAAANESKYPNVVELGVPADGLDVTLGRRIINFHKSRHIQPHHGRTITRQQQMVLFGFGNRSRLHRSVNASQEPLLTTPVMLLFARLATSGPEEVPLRQDR